MKEIKFRSYAKINLYLEVLNKRKDGYHNILTVFQMIDLSDLLTIRFKEKGGISVESSNPHVPSGKDNLIYRGIELFRNKTGMEIHLDVHIEKRIPMGGGLGGGSSNAISTLLALNTVTGNPLTFEELCAIADSLGSDTRFFLYGGTVLAQGRGERIIDRLPTPDMWFLVFCPNFSVDTGRAYRLVSQALTKPDEDVNILIEGLKEGDIGKIGKNLFNHFTPLLLEKGEVKGLLYKLKKGKGCAGVNVTGSGSCIYGIFEKRDDAVRLLPQVKGFKDVWLCRSVSASEYVQQFNQMEDLWRSQKSRSR